MNRVVVTGLGVVSPTGVGMRSFEESLFAGISGIGPVTAFDASAYATRIAGEVKDFCTDRIFPRYLVDQTARFAHFALAAAKEAVEDSGLAMEKEDSQRVGVIMGTGRGGVSSLEEMFQIGRRGGDCNPDLFAKYFPSSAAAAISVMLGARGYSASVMAACASGAIAIGNAYRILQRGDADVIIAGGCEAPLTPCLFAGACANRAMSTRNGDPRRASRPFDLSRDGYVMGEGAGVVVLETLDHAQSRSAWIYGEVAGYGLNSDAFHITAPSPDGEGVARAMNEAIREAGIGPEAVDYINAHGTSTVINDRCETLAIKKVFGTLAYRIPVSSTKSMTGHLLGAAGAVEFIICLLAMKRGLIPSTINYEKNDPQCDLDYVPNRARKKELNITISNSSGFGGHNASIVIKRAE